jgi:MFS family permease
LIPTSLALVLAAFPREKRPIAVSMWGAVGALAAAVGPAVGSAIVQTAGWRWAFYVNVPIGIVAIVRSRGRLSESSEAARGGLPDPLGVALAIASPGLLALGIIQAGDWGPTSVKTLGALAGSILLLGLLIVTASRSRSPVIDLTMFRDRNYRVANWATLVFSIAFSAMFFGLILFLTQVWRYSILRAGLAMTPGPLTVIPFAIIAGRVAAKRGHRGLLLVGGATYASSALVLLLLATERPAFLALLLPTSILLGMGIGLVLPSLSGVAVHALPSDRFALGVAVNQAVRQVGTVLGVAFVIAFVARAPMGSLAPFHGIFVLLIVGGLLTALLGLFVATAPERAATSADHPSNPSKGISQ